MRKNVIIVIIIVILLITGLLFFGFGNDKEIKAGSGDNVYGWAWSENIGWISFNNTTGGGGINYGVDVNFSDGKFSGYAWAGGGENADSTLAATIGWISFNRSETGVPPSNDACPDAPCIAKIDLTDCPAGICPVYGWARALSPIGQPLGTTGGWDGWIKLRGANYGVSFNTNTNEFEGWAWAGNDSSEQGVIGWISFNCKDGGYGEGAGEYSSFVAGQTSDGFIWGNSSTYSTARSTSDGFSITGSTLNVGQEYDAPEECDGIPTSCDDFDFTFTKYDETGCIQEGCDWVGCEGTPPSCDSFPVQFQCEWYPGCSWDGCSGSAGSCDGLSGRDCGNQYGCSWVETGYGGYCAGTPTSCDDFETELGCIDQGGCSFGGGCTGTPDSCDNYGSAFTCGRLSCDWVGCEGTPTPCDELEGFGINRGYLDFDTSTLPADAVVTDVKLSLKAQYDYSTTDFDVKIYKFSWQEPITSSNRESNYDAGGAVYDADWRNTSGMSTGVYYDSPSLDNSWVNPTGDTKYQLRSSRDVNGNQPAGNEDIAFYSANSAGNEPILKVTYTTGTGSVHYNICGVSDYKVIAYLNRPPDKPVTQQENWGACGGMPQIAFRTSVILNWLYSDPEGDIQGGYEVWVDEDSNFTGLKFNHLVNSSSQSYTLDLNDDEEGDWLSVLVWGSTYWWKVRVKDINDNWSEFSNPESFTIPNRASPNAGFTANPANPRSGEEVNFIDNSECYLADDSGYNCKDGGPEISYEWNFGDSSPIDTTKGDTAHTYEDVGNYTVRLEVADSGVGQGIGMCYEEVTVGLPLPTWKEISPF